MNTKKLPVFFEYELVPGILLLCLVAMGMACNPLELDEALDVATDRSLVVLPFEPMGQEADLPFLATEMADELRNILSTYGDLRVISKNSSDKIWDAESELMDLGERLNVKYVLLGTVHRKDQRVNFQLRMMRADIQHEIWSGSYHSPEGELFNEVKNSAFAVAEALQSRYDKRVRATLQSPVENLELREKYGEARKLVHSRAPDAVARAISILIEITRELDPNFAEAYTMLAEAHLVRAQFKYADFMQETTNCMMAALKAVELDPLQGTAHAIIAHQATTSQLYEEADRKFAAAVEISPNDPLVHRLYSLLLSATNQHDKAIAHTKKAMQLDPLDAMATVGAAQSHWFARDLKGADSLMNVLEQNFSDEWVTQLAFGDHAAYGGDFQTAAKYYEKSLEMEPDYSVGWGFLSHFYARLGRREAASAASTKSQANRNDPYALACLYSGLDDLDHAFAELEQMLAGPFKLDVIEFLISLYANPLSNDARFESLLAELGLTNYWHH